MNVEYWLRLANARNLSPLVYTRLLHCFGNPAAICQASVPELAACGVKTEAIKELQQPDAALLLREQQWAQQPHHSILTLEDERYPALLKAIADPPPVLFVRGDPAVLSRPQVALVGSRNPSPGGVKAAGEFAAALVRAQFTITSGLAIGIDGASHRGALEAGGMTVAVLGSGLSCLYPARHRQLAADVVAQGALVSEFPPETPPLAAHFPRRNRIISGLCAGVCVIEAALLSGSLITAKLAAEQGREVFAVPGSIYNPLSHGCHALIQQGAQLTASVADILMELQPQAAQRAVPSTQQSLPLELDYDCRQLLQWIGFEATTVDQIVRGSGRGVAQVIELLLTLELRGYVQAALGGYIRLK